MSGVAPIERIAGKKLRHVTYGNELDVERVITAMIVCDTTDDAIAMLQVEGLGADAVTLRNIRSEHRRRIEERRDELAPALEGILANDLLDTARRAAVITSLALERAQEKLERGLVEDPARVARDVAQVASQAIEKRLAIQGRPTQIVEHRDVAEIVRALEALGVVEVVGLPTATSL